MYFVTGLILDLQQPSTALLARTKADTLKKVLIATRIVGCWSLIAYVAAFQNDVSHPSYYE